MKTFWVLAAVIVAGAVGYAIYQKMKPTPTAARQLDTAIAEYGG